MRKQRGFSIVELVVVLTIMAILLTLAIVGLNGSQVNARNAKRKADVEAIARGLETYYKQGNPRAAGPPGFSDPGQYPGTNEMLHIQGTSRTGYTPAQIVGGYLTDALPGTTASNYIPPGASTNSFGIICVWSCQPAETASVTNAATTQTNYIYEPVGDNGEICANGNCRAYNLYYRLEDGSLQPVRSEHQ
jgi:prepilin-type N-terminal cleavage/methylation domain-containing protein